MSWQSRSNGRRYYYREKRVGRRIIKQYLGNGPQAHQAAAEDRAQRHRRALQGRQRLAPSADSASVAELRKQGLRVDGIAIEKGEAFPL